MTEIYPRDYFADTSGRTLENGKLYLGEESQDPETHPIQAYWDEALTIPAAQPITVSAGYVMNGGSRADVFFAEIAYSIRIRDRNNIEVDYIASVTDGIGLLRSDLASTASGKGAGLVGFSHSAIYAASTDGDHLKRFLVVTDDPYLAPTDGTTDATSAVQAAIDSCGAAGGGIIVPRGVKLLIDNNLTVKPNCHLVGPHRFVGSPKDNTSADYSQLGGALIINPAKTITLKGGATVSGLLVYRKGMTFPANTAAAYAGTAFTFGGDDAGITYCMVIGFAQAASCVNYQRPRFDWFYHDNLAGIYVENCLDNPRIGTCHAWPFGTIAGANGAGWADRSGSAYYFKNTADWLNLQSCFSYGYFRGVNVENCNSYTLNAVGCDGTGTYTGSIAIYINGTAGGCEDGVIFAPRCANQQTAGIRIETLTGVVTTVIGGAVWSCGTHGIWLAAGDLNLVSPSIRSCPNGVTIDSGSSRVMRHGVRMRDVTQPYSVTASNSTIYGGDDDMANLADGNTISGTNHVVPTVASANPLSLPATGELFNISGTTNFGTLQRGWAGRVVTLIFQGSLSVFHSTGSATAMALSGAATFSAVANSTLTLRHNGVQWFEIGRKA